jgi:disulfide bond formation protein DsbB
MGIASQRKLARYRVTPVLAVSLMLIASIIALGTALLSQYVGGLQPCVLCLYQRAPYALIIVLSGLALALMAFGGDRPRPALTRGLLVVFAATFLTGAGVAAYHVGVEQKWWLGTQACSGPNLNTMTIEELRDHLLRVPIVRCDEVAWSMFGISMAGYNFIVSLVLAGGCLGLARALPNRSRPGATLESLR